MVDSCQKGEVVVMKLTKAEEKKLLTNARKGIGFYSILLNTVITLLLIGLIIFLSKWIWSMVV